MTAPDPGLTDLIAAHQWIHFAPRRNSKCACGWQGDDPDYPGVGHPAHVALVVEQHSNGRIRELEAAVEHWKDRSQYNYDCGMVLANEANARAEKAEATIARVERALEAAEKSVPDDWGVTYIYTSRLRATLEGEQQ